MADFETKLRWLSERGTPVGAEELIERIEADLAGDPLVVVAKRREGTLMTKTQQPEVTGQARRMRGPAWAVAAFVAVLTVAGLYLAFSGDEEDLVADTTPSPTTTVAQTTTDLETIEAAVAAFYSGDGERAAELFELSDRTDDQIRGESAYQAAIGGRLTLNCIEETAPGVFTCRTPYHNAMTDAIGYGDSGDTNEVVVEEGVITEFVFPEHYFMVGQMGTFLAMEGRLTGYENCSSGPFHESCATIQMENLDSWVDWRQTLEAEALVEFALQSWYGGDCESTRFVSGISTNICAIPDGRTHMIEYESILGADVSIEACQDPVPTADGLRVSCEVHYSNAQSTAVGKPPSVTTREFVAHLDSGVIGSPSSVLPWYAVDYPEDTELRESFRAFAEGGDLADEYAAAGCATSRSPNCADLIVDNLDDWAAWHQTNG